jgi:hypothetical protein
VRYQTSAILVVLLWMMHSATPGAAESSLQSVLRDLSVSQLRARTISIEWMQTDVQCETPSDVSVEATAITGEHVGLTQSSTQERYRVLMDGSSFRMDIWGTSRRADGTAYVPVHRTRWFIAGVSTEFTEFDPGLAKHRSVR